MVRDFITANTDETLQRAARLMTDNKVDCLPVMEKERVQGIITFGDLWSGIGKGKRMVGEIITHPVITIPTFASIFEAKELMDVHRIGKLLIVDHGRLVGMVSKPELYFEIGKNVDELTGFYKKEYILYIGTKLLLAEQEFCIAFIDINNFGHIDKAYGHHFGDEILKNFAAKLYKNKPEGAILCRYGGDEFVLVLSYSMEKSMLFVDNLLKNTSKMCCIDDIKITATVGLTIYNPHDIEALKHKSRDDIILNLINNASLASSKAKKSRHRLEIFKG